MSADTFRKLAALGLTTDQIAGVLDIMDEAAAQTIAREEARKADARERWHRWNSKRKANISKHEQTLANNSRGGDARGLDNLQTKNQAGEKGKEEKDAPAALSSFPEFWNLYPNKVGKREAEKAFAKAVKRADLATILGGLRAYVAKTDDRPWCNPATWLNQDRWEDRPATPPPRLPAYPPEPRNVGELTILEAKRGDIFDAPFRSPRLDDESDRNTGFAGTGIARRIAIAAAGRS